MVPSKTPSGDTTLSAEATGLAPVPPRDVRKAAAGDPFPALGDGTLMDRQMGLRWTTTGSPSQGATGFLWAEADAYCRELALGRSSAWRLPTQPELASILERLDPTRYPWGLTLWSADRPSGEPDRFWVTNSPLYAPQWSLALRDQSGRRLTHRAVCVTTDLEQQPTGGRLPGRRPRMPGARLGPATGATTPGTARQPARRAPDPRDLPDQG